MLTTGKELVILKGKLQENIKSIEYNSERKQYDVEFRNNKRYSYSLGNCVYVREGKSINLDYIKMYNLSGVELRNVEEAILYESNERKYYKIRYAGNSREVLEENEIIIEVSALRDDRVRANIDYFKEITCVLESSREAKEKVLSNQYQRMKFIDRNSVLAMYLKGKVPPNNKRNSGITTIFPFGSNASQIRAVNNALDSAVSIIEGPPGTGKTQTILNIIEFPDLSDHI